ncbi:MAG: ShlB/FhaC/HecB family hemolysin secretion/activation protein [Cyanobacteria bacterium]|nr:ShlB/FhaC/HecB family hemolysin secretion/activation protein [Cyanobacteriota bacterium]MDW8201799.1 ShlB/FhaC/HecB family hemolysin secretion/activation protein [Cyanobacteriota bacterium SKYGB_h_bin112]
MLVVSVLWGTIAGLALVSAPPTLTQPVSQLPEFQPRPAEPLPTQVLPPPSELLPPLPDSQRPELPTGDVPETVVVQRYNVTGSTIFSPEELEAITKEFTGRVTITEIFQARSAITQLYVSKGYVTSGAFIPEQTLQGGVVEIRVVEGTVEEIRVAGNQRLSPGYVQSRLALATGAPLNRDRLLQALQLLQQNPLIQNLSAELSAGIRPGTSLLTVQITEADSFNTSLIFDNQRSPSVGTDRRQLQITEANLLGLGDSLALTYTNTDGSNAFDASYTLPLSPYNTTVTFSYSTSGSRVIELPFDVLRINSGSYTYEASLRQPIIQTPSQELALGLTFSRRQSEATLLGGTIPFPSLGADNEGRSVVSALRFVQEFTDRSSEQVFAARSQFSIGLDALGATINNALPDSRFFTWRGQAQYVRLLAPETLLLVRADLQLADRPLLSLEQFGLGGVNTVRGYRQDLLLTDNGILATAEVRLPILRIPELPLLLQVVPFVDIGTGWNSGLRPNPTESTLISAGLGLRLQVSNQLTARFDWGIPLSTPSPAARTWQENGLYFSVVYTPF